ncbi:MAG: PEP-CTERM/exosortase system-associated acyltransferase, partial [Gammaproteobacteria bacterium]|nr:PEP-CTERM/exosortase system-associated acyltransferase [Gammaproteobacteria bacterium]
GPQIEYHGKRQPCYSFLDELLDRVMEERPDVWEVLTEKGSFGPHHNRARSPVQSGSFNKAL